MSPRNRCGQCGSFKKQGHCNHCERGADKPAYNHGKSTRMPLKGNRDGKSLLAAAHREAHDPRTEELTASQNK